jgi:hypothetical protein
MPFTQNRTVSCMMAALLLTAAPLALKAGTAHEETASSTKENPRRTHSGSSEGIWKAAIPPGSMKGEFDSHDPIGLASGALIKADCSINWVNPDTGKLYCFSSGTSLVYFLNWPKKNTKRARKGWLKLNSPGN